MNFLRNFISAPTPTPTPTTILTRLSSAIKSSVPTKTPTIVLAHWASATSFLNDKKAISSAWHSIRSTYSSITHEALPTLSSVATAASNKMNSFLITKIYNANTETLGRNRKSVPWATATLEAGPVKSIVYPGFEAVEYWWGMQALFFVVLGLLTLGSLWHLLDSVIRPQWAGGENSVGKVQELQGKNGKRPQRLNVEGSEDVTVRKEHASRRARTPLRSEFADETEAWAEEDRALGGRQRKTVRRRATTQDGKKRIFEEQWLQAWGAE